MSDFEDPRELRVNGESDSRAVWDRIVEYDEALNAGKPVDLHDDAMILALPKTAQAQLFGVLNCLDLLLQIRRQDRRTESLLSRRTVVQRAPAGGTSLIGSLMASANEAPLLTIGQFEVLHEIGRGGHGVVFAATDRILRRSVALKVPRPEFLLSKAMRARFIAEARAGGRLLSPNSRKVFVAGA